MADETQAPVADEFDLPLSSSENTAQPEEAPPSEPSAEPSAPPPNPLADQLRAEGLREIPGEATEQTYHRIVRHLQGKGNRFYAEMQAARAAQERELRQIREWVEPMAREHFARQRAEATAQAAAEIPDKVTDPQGYQIWLQEQLLIRSEEERQEALRAAQEQQERQAAEQVSFQLRAVDDAGFNALQTGLGLAPGSTADPELVDAYNVLTAIAYKAVVAKWPNSTEEERMEFLENAQQLDVRDWVIAGIDPRQGVKDRVKELREMLGVAAKSNGDGQTAPPPAPQAPPAPAAARTSPTATKMQADAAAAARRAPVTAAAPARPAPAPGGLPDPSSFENDDDYVEAVMSGLLGDEKQRVGHLMKER